MGVSTVPLTMDVDLFSDQTEDTRQIGMLRERIGRLGPFDRAIVLLWLENKCPTSSKDSVGHFGYRWG